MVARTSCGALIDEIRITDLDFDDDIVILAESLDVLRSALLSLSEKAEPLGLKISWVKIKVQSFVGFLRDSISSASVAIENVEVVDHFTYLNNMIHSSISCEFEVLKRLGSADVVVKSLNKDV
ncbi:uncharacterized protein LOC128249775 [Octopus bimaculoides]|uniref:uncharacterized protein LOC128249775 n=1 Tax=Octopus bimaculoides TaxID=37653 RepID=UPI0022E36362|nr:uncharacterized protein LOC128249775 [Octopus bimaculoides]